MDANAASLPPSVDSESLPDSVGTEILDDACDCVDDPSTSVASASTSIAALPLHIIDNSSLDIGIDDLDDVLPADDDDEEPLPNESEEPLPSEAPDDLGEFYSPPRCVPRAVSLGLKAVLSLDLETGWNFSNAAHRARSLQLLRIRAVVFLVLCPPCTMFSAIQKLWNFKRMDSE